MFDAVFDLPNLGGEIVDVDLRGGGWVAAVRTTPRTVVVAWDGGRSQPLEAGHPRVRRDPAGRLLLVDMRTAAGRPNGWWLDPDGGDWCPIYLGDAVEDFAVFGDRIAVAHFDEAYGAKDGHHGFVVLAEDGAIKWSSERAGVDVFSVYCMCVSGRHQVLFVDYPSWAVLRLDVESRALHRTALPEALTGPDAVTSLGDRLCCHGTYDEPDTLLAWRRGRERIHRLGTYPGPLRGIEGGRFLAHGPHGYTVVDVAEDLKHLD